MRTAEQRHLRQANIVRWREPKTERKKTSVFPTPGFQTTKASRGQIAGNLAPLEVRGAGMLDDACCRYARSPSRKRHAKNEGGGACQPLHFPGADAPGILHKGRSKCALLPLRNIFQSLSW